MDPGSSLRPRRNGFDRTGADWLPEVIDRIVREYRPVKIVQVDWPPDPAGDGGDATQDATYKGIPAVSLDLLVVMPDSWRPEGKANPAREIMERLKDIPVFLSITVTTPRQLARHGHVEGTTLHRALTRGRVIYERE